MLACATKKECIATKRVAQVVVGDAAVMHYAGLQDQDKA